MQSRDEQRERAAELLAQHLVEKGLAETSLRQLAAAADVSDRMLIYYFGSKTEAIRQAMMKAAAGLTLQLATAEGLEDPQPLPAILPRFTAIFSSEEMKPYMGIWIESVAAARRGEEPFAEMVREIAVFFLDWMETKIAHDDPDRRRDQAALVLGLVDGFALLRACTSEAITERAQTELNRLLSMLD